ncbi:hypothetical protein BJV82DRAFT_583898 [Fennellomyces sp. T-0311]|nr:hypothetical protein BJV82DRAFT_583898 [Fennellomyces sp. T-0311]
MIFEIAIQLLTAIFVTHLIFLSLLGFLVGLLLPFALPLLATRGIISVALHFWRLVPRGWFARRSAAYCDEPSPTTPILPAEELPEYDPAFPPVQPPISPVLEPALSLNDIQLEIRHYGLEESPFLKSLMSSTPPSFSHCTSPSAPSTFTLEQYDAYSSPRQLPKNKKRVRFLLPSGRDDNDDASTTRPQRPRKSKRRSSTRRFGSD